MYSSLCAAEERHAARDDFCNLSSRRRFGENEIEYRTVLIRTFVRDVCKTIGWMLNVSRLFQLRVVKQSHAMIDSMSLR